MDPRVSFVTLVVRSVAASRRFYVDGLGWPVEFESPEDVVMIRVGERVVLSLWDEGAAVAELGAVGRTSAALPFTLAHNVATPEAVDAVLDEVQRAGATAMAAVWRDWGGYSGYFIDPDGFRWEVAYNPGPIGQSVL